MNFRVIYPEIPLDHPASRLGAPEIFPCSTTPAIVKPVSEGAGCLFPVELSESITLSATLALRTHLSQPKFAPDIQVVHYLNAVFHYFHPPHAPGIRLPSLHAGHRKAPVLALTSGSPHPHNLVGTIQMCMIQIITCRPDRRHRYRQGTQAIDIR